MPFGWGGSGQWAGTLFQVPLKTNMGYFYHLYIVWLLNIFLILIFWPFILVNYNIFLSYITLYYYILGFIMIVMIFNHYIEVIYDFF